MDTLSEKDKSDSNEKLIGTAATMISAIYFGIAPILSNNAMLEGCSALTVSMLRFLVSIPLLYLFIRIAHLDLHVTKAEIRDIALLSILGQGATTVLFFWSFNFMSTGTSTTIHFMYPACTVLGCMIFLKEKISRNKLICVILSTIGILLIYNGGGDLNMTGFVLSFASSFTYAFYSIYLEHSEARKVPSMVVIFYLNIFATVFIGLLALFTDNLTFDMTSKGWVCAVLLSLGNTFVGMFGFQIGVKRIGAQNSTMLSTVEPVTCIILGAIIFDEKIIPRIIVGTVFILAATIAIAKSVKKE